ncbi:uncharacterized protein ACDP82_018064 [Pangshura tecta]
MRCKSCPSFPEESSRSPSWYQGKISHVPESTALMRWKAKESDDTLRRAQGLHFQRLLSSLARSGEFSAAEGWIQEDDCRWCTSRGSVQEPQPEEKLAEVDLISLNILLSRHEQSSAFCLAHNNAS